MEPDECTRAEVCEGAVNSSQAGLLCQIAPVSHEMNNPCPLHSYYPLYKRESISLNSQPAI